MLFKGAAGFACAMASLLSPWLTAVSHSQTLTIEAALRRGLAVSPRLTAERDIGIAKEQRFQAGALLNPEPSYGLNNSLGSRAYRGTQSAESPLQISQLFELFSREDDKRRFVVSANLRGRKLGSFVSDAQRQTGEKVKTLGYGIAWGGQFFKQLVAATECLMVVVSLALALIFLLMFISLGSAADAILVLGGVPLALTGGIFALILRDIPLLISVRRFARFRSDGDPDGRRCAGAAMARGRRQRRHQHVHRPDFARSAGAQRSVPPRIVTRADGSHGVCLAGRIPCLRAACTSEVRKEARWRVSPASTSNGRLWKHVRVQTFSTKQTSPFRARDSAGR